MQSACSSKFYLALLKVGAIIFLYPGIKKEFSDELLFYALWLAAFFIHYRLWF